MTDRYAGGPAPAGPTVLWTVAKAPEGIDFRTQVITALSGRVDLSYFTWRRALLSSYDVFHIQWPETIYRHPTWFGSMVKATLTLALLMRLRLRRVAVVQTIHNPTPHEPGGRLERFLLRAIERAVHVKITLNRTDAMRDSQAVLALHPHFRDFVAPTGVGMANPRRVVMFGYLRPYKGVEDLICSIRDRPEIEMEICIVGAPITPSYGARLTTLASGDHRIHLDLRLASDSEMEAAIASASLVVLPYRRMHNSGVALMALSLNRPVLLQPGATTDELQREFGSEWIRVADPNALAESMDEALLDRRWVHASMPMEGRDLVTFSDAHIAAYRRAQQLSKMRRKRRRA